METKQPNIERLIARKISGDITDDELMQLFAWVENAEENANLYRQLISVMSEQAIQEKKELVWQKTMVKSKLVNRAGSKLVSIFRSREWRVAAMLAVIFLIPLLLGKFGEDGNGNGLMHTVKGEDVTTSFYLPDGSLVVLARGSVIRYSDDYSCANRELELEGKAFLNIKACCVNPVVVKTGRTCTVANSGSINIDYSEDNVDVAVKSGMVAVVDSSKYRIVCPLIKIRPANALNVKVKSPLTNDNLAFDKEKINYSENEGFSKKPMGNECEVFGWKDREMCFHEKSIYHIAKVISQWFGTNVELKGNIDPTARFSGSFQDPDLKFLLEQLFREDIYSFKIKGDNLIIKAQ
ncbi:FecR family protein [Marinilabiliaceae bacterium JC017]|nr:FecR family protein [Marinilabiliaceae bacterium JC017]